MIVGIVLRVSHAQDGKLANMRVCGCFSGFKYLSSLHVVDINNIPPLHDEHGLVFNRKE